MNDLLTKIFAKFVPGSALYDALGGQLYYDRAPDGISEPYGIYRGTTATPEDVFDQDVDEVGVQFSFFASSMGLANTLTTDCKALYDGKELSDGTILQRALTIPSRRSSGDDDATWQADIEFLTLHEV